MKYRILLLAASLFLAPPAAQAQRRVFIPFRADTWVGSWGGGTWGGSLYTPYNTGWGASAYYNPYVVPTYADPNYYSGPIILSGFTAADPPRMRPTIYPAIAPPTKEVIRAALEGK
jgi:hypothetical protein